MMAADRIAPVLCLLLASSSFLVLMLPFLFPGATVDATSPLLDHAIQAIGDCPQEHQQEVYACTILTSPFYGLQPWYENDRPKDRLLRAAGRLRLPLFCDGGVNGVAAYLANFTMALDRAIAPRGRCTAYSTVRQCTHPAVQVLVWVVLASPAAAPKMSQAKITNFFSKPKTNGGGVTTTTTTSNGNNSNSSSPSVVDKPPPPPKHNLDLWTSTYRPKTSDQLVGNATARGHFFEWLSNWQENFVDDGHLAGEILTGKCAFICGPSGTGKTSLVRAIAADLHHSVLEFSCSSRRVSPAFLAKEVGESVKSHCINITSNAAKKFGKSLILLDDFDGLLFEPESSSLAEVCRQLRQLITTSQKPIVITAAYQPSSFFCSSSSSAESSELTSYFRLFQLGGIHRTVLRKHLETITSAKESTAGAGAAAVQLPSNSALLLRCGDARRLINECQFWCSGASSSQETPKRTASQPCKPTISAQKLIQQLDLLSLEDVYQTTLNRLSAESADYYNCHLFDRRHSLLTPELNAGEADEQKEELASVADCCEVISESICSLLAGHYLPLTPRDPDYFALLFDLIALRPGLLAELEKLFLHSGQQMRRSSRIKRRQQKLSF
ncbi:ATPase AAA domain-containing protein 5, partial [Tyrophagus putrescentiae]